MKLLILTAFVALVAVSSATYVEVWGDDDFASNMAKHDIVLVKFYAPWCGHCKKIAPEFDRASIALSNNDPPVTLVKIDCTAEGKATCSKHGVSGYPTLKIFRGGDVNNKEDYGGPREADGIVKYMKGKAGPTSKTLATMADLDKFKDNMDHSIVGFFSDAKSDLAQKFKSLADLMSEDYRFAMTTSADVLEASGHKDVMVLFRPARLLNKFDEDVSVYSGEAERDAMKLWVVKNFHGFAGHRTSANQKQFKNPLITVYYDVDYVLNIKGSNYWRNRVMKVAKKIQAEGLDMKFAVAAHEEFGQELSEMGLSYRDSPVVAGRDAADRKFVMTEKFSMDTLEQFVRDVLDGTLEPFLKSEALPDNSGPLKTAVGKNFDELVNDETKDVLIEFYAPWCGHCKTLAPKYQELAEKLEGEEGIAIVKMDATANDVPKNFDVRGFPTLYFVPKDNSVKKYEGGREVSDFINYLAKESTDPLTGYDRQGKPTKTEL